MLSSIEHVCVSAVYVFVVLKICCCVGNTAGVHARAFAGPLIDDLLETFWQRFVCLKTETKQDLFVRMFGFWSHSWFEICKVSTRTQTNKVSETSVECDAVV